MSSFAHSPPSSLRGRSSKRKKINTIVVTGGVVSGLGKGITISSVGVILKAVGLRVTSIKIDPYLNTDAGTMSPLNTAKCVWLNDGGEVDLTWVTTSVFGYPADQGPQHHDGQSIPASYPARASWRLLGKTVQVVPHVTNAIQDWIERVVLSRRRRSPYMSASSKLVELLVISSR